MHTSRTGSSTLLSRLLPDGQLWPGSFPRAAGPQASHKEPTGREEGSKSSLPRAQLGKDSAQEVSWHRTATCEGRAGWDRQLRCPWLPPWTGKGNLGNGQTEPSAGAKVAVWVQLSLGPGGHTGWPEV